MVTDSRLFFQGVLLNDSSLTFDVTDEVILLGTFLGSNFEVLRSIYKTYRQLDDYYEYQPLVGGKLSVSFNYEEQTVCLDRQTMQVTLTLPQLLQFMGKVDVTFGPIYPVGTTVELDEEMFTEDLNEMFGTSDIGALVTLAGRKIPLREGFDHYIVDYLGRLWPFGEMPGTQPILVSNMMIKRVVEKGYSDKYDEQFTFDVLRATQVLQEQVSTAFMTTEDALAYFDFDFLDEKSESEET